MKQTAVEYLLSYLPQIDYGNDPYYDEIIKKAKRLEKEQITDANERGFVVGCKDIGETAVDYYEKTFKNK